MKNLELSIAEILHRGYTIMSESEAHMIFGYLERHFWFRRNVVVGTKILPNGLIAVYV